MTSDLKVLSVTNRQHLHFWQVPVSFPVCENTIIQTNTLAKKKNDILIIDHEQQLTRNAK